MKLSYFLDQNQLLLPIAALMRLLALCYGTIFPLIDSLDDLNWRY